MREHDVPYHVRFEIDTDVRCGHWFTCKAKVGGGGGRGGQGAGPGVSGAWQLPPLCVQLDRLPLCAPPRACCPHLPRLNADVPPGLPPQGGKVTLERRADLLQRAEPRICAFDIGGNIGELPGRCHKKMRWCGCRCPCLHQALPCTFPRPPRAETTKLPLQFPNAEYDQARGCCCCYRSAALPAAAVLLFLLLLRPLLPLACGSDVSPLCTPCPPLPRCAASQVFMISYMVDRQGYLIINREVGGGAGVGCWPCCGTPQAGRLLAAGRVRSAGMGAPAAVHILP